MADTRKYNKKAMGNYLTRAPARDTTGAGRAEYGPGSTDGLIGMRTMGGNVGNDVLARRMAMAQAAGGLRAQNPSAGQASYSPQTAGPARTAQMPTAGTYGTYGGGMSPRTMGGSQAGGFGGLAALMQQGQAASPQLQNGWYQQLAQRLAMQRMLQQMAQGYGGGGQMNYGGSPAFNEGFGGGGQMNYGGSPTFNEGFGGGMVGLY